MEAIVVVLIGLGVANFLSEDTLGRLRGFGSLLDWRNGGDAVTHLILIELEVEFDKGLISLPTG
jgi:hypothetical protein